MFVLALGFLSSGRSSIIHPVGLAISLDSRDYSVLVSIIRITRVGLLGANRERQELITLLRL